MTIPKSVNLREDGDVDILYLYTEIGNKNISIAECPDAKGFISAIFSDCGATCIQIVLNKKEANLVADALNELCQEK